MPNGNGAMDVNNRYQYVDFERALGTVSTTVGTVSLFDPFAVLFAAAPQTTRVVYQDGAVRWRQSVFVSHMEVRFRCIGAESTALLPADIHNVMRVLIWETDDDTPVVTPSPLTSVDDPLALADTNRIYWDNTSLLASQAFNSADYNSPQMQFQLKVFKIQRSYDWNSNISAGTSGWFTKKGNIQLSAVSDSAATPHPQYMLSARIYFRFGRNGGTQY